MEEKFEQVEKILRKTGQEHLLKQYERLTDDKKKQEFLNSILTIDFDAINEIYLNSKKNITNKDFTIEPIKFIDKERIDEKEYIEYEKLGKEIIKNGKLAFQCETNLGKSLSEDEWKQIISQIDEKQYVQVFGFNKEQLDQFQFSSKQEMDQFLYSVSLTGSEEWMKLSTSLQKQAEAIFTPKAVKRMMNQQLQQLDLQMMKIEELAQDNGGKII